MKLDQNDKLMSRLYCLDISSIGVKLEVFCNEHIFGSGSNFSLQSLSTLFVDAPFRPLLSLYMWWIPFFSIAFAAILAGRRLDWHSKKCFWGLTRRRALSKPSDVTLLPNFGIFPLLNLWHLKLRNQSSFCASQRSFTQALRGLCSS